MRVLGIDPGVEGGIAVAGDRKDNILAVEPVHRTMTEIEITDLLTSIIDFYGTRICYFEKVGYKRGDGGKGAFTFGRITGFLRGIVLARRVKIVTVSPMRWMSAMGCLTGGNKNVSKTAAIQLFPSAWEKALTHNTADAALIAAYGVRRETEKA